MFKIIIVTSLFFSGLLLISCEDDPLLGPQVSDCAPGDSYCEISLPGDKKDDQSRVVTPYDALVNKKVDAIVMGRSLVRGNIKNNIKKLIDHLNK